MVAWNRKETAQLWGTPSGAAEVGGATLSDAATRALDEGGDDLEEYIPALISLTAKPGLTLTGRVAPYWPIFEGTSKDAFEVEYLQGVLLVSNSAVNDEGHPYPLDVEAQQGSLSKFFDVFGPLLEQRLTQVMTREFGAVLNLGTQAIIEARRGPPQPEASPVRGEPRRRIEADPGNFIDQRT